jgi:Zn-dependent protease
MANFPNALMWYVVFLLSTTCHEAAHAFAAMKMGDLTAYENGQVTLNPLPHVKREPVGTIVVPIISFLIGGWMIGWASAPYNPEWAYKYPKKSAAMAAAGPMANFILIVISALLIHLGITLNIFYAPDTIKGVDIVSAVNSGIYGGIAKILGISFILNSILFLFNLIPVPPLDGSAILTMYLNEENGRKYIGKINSYAFEFIGIIIAWYVFDFIYSGLHTVLINILYPGSNYH